MQCEKGPLCFFISSAVGGCHSGFLFHGEKASRAFRRSTRTPLRCVVQSPSSQGSLCPLSCGWGPGRWLCWSGRIWSGKESLEETGWGWWWQEDVVTWQQCTYLSCKNHFEWGCGKYVMLMHLFSVPESWELPVTQRREIDNQRYTVTERVRSGVEIEGQREGARRRYREMEERAGGRRGNARWWDQWAAWVTAARRGMDVKEERK